jgi:hypothetical protein
VALTVSLGSFALWVLNPYAGLLAVPAAHLWMLAVLVRPPPSRRARLLMVAGGLLAPLLVTVYYLFALSLDPLHGAWYLLGLVTGHSVGIAMSLAGCLMLAAVCGCRARRNRRPERRGRPCSAPGPMRAPAPSVERARRCRGGESARAECSGRAHQRHRPDLYRHWR